MLLADVYLVHEDQLIDPQWSRTIKTHDWRNYVTLEVREQWSELTALGQAAVFVVANTAACNEEWD